MALAFIHSASVWLVIVYKPRVFPADVANCFNCFAGINIPAETYARLGSRNTRNELN
jgi:hypothetical protein